MSMKAMGLKPNEILAEGKYYKKDVEFDGNITDGVIWSISNQKKEDEKVYTYDEAIDLTGNGWYNIGLLITLALTIQAMALDMFGFSYVVAAAACDLQFTHKQTSFLLTVPLLGAIFSAYPWGYFSDTRGRKKSLIIAMWGSFILSSLSAFSPNFTVLAVLKFFCCSLSSGGQSLSYTLLGESCCTRTKGSYMLIMTGALMCALGVITAHAYIVLGMDFTYDLGYITFKPWRLLILTMAMALGSSASLIHFFYESPKFLVNIGRMAEAVEILKKMKRRNHNYGPFTVKKIILLEASSLCKNKASFLRSLWDQTAPLFKPPLLKWTVILFYLTAIIYSVNNGLYIWIPIIFNSIFEESSALNANATNSLCDIIISKHSQRESGDCTSVVSLNMLLTSIFQGLIFITLNFGVARLNHRKKTVTILTFFLSALCCFGIVFVTEKITTVIFFFGIQLNCYSMGIVFTYFIELFPTRNRGMISCLGIMVARASALVGVNLIGAYTFTHCTTSLFMWGAYTLSGVIVAFLLPSDTPKILS